MKILNLLKQLSLILIFSSFLSAEVSEAAKSLAKESEDYCSSTASVKPTPAMIIAKVNEAVKAVNAEGKKAFSKFKGKGSAFLFAGTYIWINDLKGNMLMHPIKPGMEGQALLGLKDPDGKLFFVEMIDVVNKKGEGWVEYKWPKPGSKERSTKISFVKKAKVDGVDVLVGCGVYDMTMAEINAAKK